MKYARLIFSAIICLIIIVPAKADTFFFGDSLTDSGNTDDLTFGISPGAPYVDGRFSNGPTWAEVFAEQVGGSAVASRLGGTNYAHGGARTTTSLFRPGFDSQVEFFLDSGINPTADDLFVVWIGSNDVFDAFEAADPNQAVTDTLDNIVTSIGELYDGGVQRMMVLNAGAIGQTPLYRSLGNAAADAVDSLAVSFNAQLADRLQSIRGSTNLQIQEIDLFPLFGEVVADPSAFGLTNAIDSSTPFDEFGLATGDATVDPEQYFFWDGIHPTAAGHRIIANRVFIQSIPEPSSVVLLCLFSNLLLVRRRA